MRGDVTGTEPVLDRGAEAMALGGPWPLRVRSALRSVSARLPRHVRTSRLLRLAGLACLLGLLYALGAVLPFWYLKQPDAGAAFFPPAGLTLAVLLLTPRRLWPLWLAVVATVEIGVDLTHGQTVVMAIGFAL